MVIVGPCSVHDVDAAMEYAKLLKAYADEHKEDLHILSERTLTFAFWTRERRKKLTRHFSEGVLRKAKDDRRMEGSFTIQA